MPTGRPESTRNTAIRTLRKAQQAIHVEEPAKRSINSTQPPTGWFGKIPQLVFGALALAHRATGIIVISTPTMPEESTETPTSSAQNPDTTTSTLRPDTTSTTKKIDTTTSTQRLDTTSTTKKIDTTTSTQKLDTTSTTKKLDTTTSTQRLDTTSTTKKLDTTTSTQRLDTTSTTKKIDTTTSAQRLDTTSTTKKIDTTTSTQKLDTTSTTKKLDTTTTKKPYERTSTKKLDSTTTAKKPYTTPSTRKSYVTTSTQRFVTSTKKPCTTKGQKPPVGLSASSSSSRSGKSSFSSPYHKKSYRNHGGWKGHNRREFMYPQQTNTSFEEPLHIGTASSDSYSAGLISLAIGGGVVLSVGTIILLIRLYQHYKSQNNVLPVVDVKPDAPHINPSIFGKNGFFNTEQQSADGAAQEEVLDIDTQEQVQMVIGAAAR